MQSQRIAIIGAGFSGLGMAYYLRQAGIESFTIYEKAAALGGVWRENTYPGAACDVPSHLYSFSFEPHYPWSKAYGPQPEILDYQNQVGRKHDLLRHIRFGRELVGADFQDAEGTWLLRFADGATETAEVLICGVGQLHRPAYPKVPGMERFRGRTFHSAQWQHDYDFRDKTVASIGTGPSAIQYVPEIAKQVKRLHVYQRSPAWCLPKWDRPFNALERWLLRQLPWTHSLDRLRIYWYAEFLSSAVQSKSVVGWLAKNLIRGISALQLRLQVKDPELRRKLKPDFAVGCKRLLFSNEWLRTLSAPQTELVTEAVTEITETGVRTADGKHREVDAIVYGTGFAATEFLAPMDFRGLGGVSLRERWRGGAEAYLGLTVSGFPNFFLLYGPNTNLGIGTIIYMLERQQRYIVQCLRLLQERRLKYLDVQPEAQRRYSSELQARSRDLVYLAGCNSWYLTDGRNTNNWVGYMSEYGWRLRQPQLADYRLVA